MALNNIAFLLTGLGRQEEAIDYAERAYALEPNNPSVMDTLGTTLLAAGEPERALLLLESAARQLPGNPGVRFRYAQALVAMDETAAARRLLDEILADDQPFGNREDVEALAEQLAQP